MNRPNEILIRLWMVFAVADRTREPRERRSKNYAAALVSLARTPFDGRWAPFRTEEAEAEGYGYDALADAIWIHRGAIAKLINYTVASPEKNFFAPEKPVIRKLGRFVHENKDTDLASCFMTLFSDNDDDVRSLRQLFGRRPEDAPWLGVPAIGWGVPKDVFWIGISGGEQRWPEDEHERATYRSRLALQPFPANELWPQDERARAVHLQKLLRPFPSPTRSHWSTEPLLHAQEWKVWYTPEFFWRDFLPALAKMHGATFVDQVERECIYAAPCSFGPYSGGVAFWFPSLRGSYERPSQYRTSLQAGRKALRLKRYSPDSYVMATSSFRHRMVYGDVYPLARAGALPRPLLVIDEPCTFQYIATMPWLFFLHDPSENPRDNLPFPIIHADGQHERDARVLLYLAVWILQTAASGPPPEDFVRAFVDSVAPGQFDGARTALIDARLLSTHDACLCHHNVPVPGLWDLPRLLHALGFEQVEEQLFTWIAAQADRSEYARTVKRFQSKR